MFHSRIPRNTFYSYYSDILDLLHEIDQDLLGSLWQHLVAYLDTDPNSGDSIPAEVIDFFQKNKSRFAIMLHADSFFQKKLINLLRQKFYQSSDPLIKIYRSECAIAALYQLITQWFQREQDLPADKLLELAKDIDSWYLQK